MSFLILIRSGQTNIRWNTTYDYMIDINITKYFKLFVGWNCHLNPFVSWYKTYSFILKIDLQSKLKLIEDSQNTQPKRKFKMNLKINGLTNVVLLYYLSHYFMEMMH